MKKLVLGLLLCLAPSIAAAEANPVELLAVGLAGPGPIVITSDTSVQIPLGSDAGDDFNVGLNYFVVEGDTQRVGVGTAAPITSAALDITSTTGALVVPRTTMASISTPANGMLIYDTGTNMFELYENGAWVNLSSGGAPAFLGLTDTPGSFAQSNAVYKVNNAGNAVAESLTVVTDAGWLGLNETTPDSVLDVASVSTTQEPTITVDNLTNVAGVGAAEQVAAIVMSGQNNSVQHNLARISAVQDDNTFSSTTANFAGSRLEFYTQTQAAGDNTDPTAVDPAMVIDKSGRVGINTEQPTEPLTVSGFANLETLEANPPAAFSGAGQLTWTGTTTVTGSAGSLFSSELRPGDVIAANGEARYVRSITNNTTLITTQPFTGSVGPLGYSITTSAAVMTEAGTDQFGVSFPSIDGDSKMLVFNGGDSIVEFQSADGASGVTVTTDSDGAEIETWYMGTVYNAGASYLSLINGTSGAVTGITIDEANLVGIGKKADAGVELDLVGDMQMTGTIDVQGGTVQDTTGALTVSSDSGVTVARTAGATTGIETGLTILRDPTGTAADTIGTELLFVSEDSGANATSYGQIEVIADDVTDGTEDSTMLFKTLSAGAEETALQINEFGYIGLGGFDSFFPVTVYESALPPTATTTLVQYRGDTATPASITANYGIGENIVLDASATRTGLVPYQRQVFWADVTDSAEKSTFRIQLFDGGTVTAMQLVADDSVTFPGTLAVNGDSITADGTLDIDGATGVTITPTAGDFSATVAAGDDIILQTGAGGQMRLTSDGRMDVAGSLVTTPANFFAGDGTVTSTGTTTIEGTSTDFVAQFRAGDVISSNGESRFVESITDLDTLVLTEPFSGSFGPLAYNVVQASFTALQSDGDFGFTVNGNESLPLVTINDDDNAIVDITSTDGSTLVRMTSDLNGGDIASFSIGNNNNTGTSYWFAANGKAVSASGITVGESNLVGIGKIAAAGIELDVNGDIAASGNISANGGLIDSSSALDITPVDESSLAVNVSGAGDFIVDTDDGADVSLIVDGTTGNVGIGAAPDSVLDISDVSTTQYPRITIDNLTSIDGVGGDEEIASIVFSGEKNLIQHNAARISVAQDTTTWSGVTAHIASSRLEFYTQDQTSTDQTDPTATAPHMVIDAAGRVGIGMENPDNQLEVNGNITTNGVPGRYLISTGVYSDQIGQLSDFAANAPGMYFSAGGQLNLVANKADAQTLAADGGIFFPLLAGSTLGGNVVAALFDNTTHELFEDTSSARFKDNIRDLEPDSEAVYDLRPATFERKSDGGTTFGLIAEEVAEVLPELVSLKDGQPNAVHYGLLPVLMLEEMKHLRARVEALEEQCNDE